MNQPSPAQSEAVITHKPYIADEQIIPEFSFVPVFVGAILGVIFGASSLYLVLKVGMTISASIPVAVISITLFRLIAKIFKVRAATILENNIVQTTGSAGESIAFGVGVTMPALMMLGYDMDVVRVMTVACLGGLLGILMMIPLRRGLIVKQHGKLTYPEGTACAEVLMVGEKGGTEAKTVFSGFGLGFLYKFCVEGLQLWKKEPSRILGWYKGVEVSGELAPELLGVGFIIGPATGCIMMAGGVLSTLVIIPLIKLVGEHLTTPLYPGTKLISAMQTYEIWKSYVLYIGAGAVATGGIISLFSSIPLIYSSFREGIKDIGGGTQAGQKVRRTEDDLPMSFVIIGTLLLVLAIWLTPVLNVNLVGAVLIILFGFLFVTVSSRLTGEIGSSSNPISGMTVSTLLLTCLIFLGMGWTGAGYRLAALSIAAVVCIAASNGGTTSQDLKTGFLVGGTPKYQQIAILVGALTSAVFIGFTLLILNEASTVYLKPPKAITYKADVAKLSVREKVKGPEGKLDQKDYLVMFLTEPEGNLQPGKYLLNDDGTIAYIVDPGINGVEKYRDCNHRYLPPPPNKTRIDVATINTWEPLRGPDAAKDPNEYGVLILEQEIEGVPAGKYMVDREGAIKYIVDQGPRVTKFDSPKAKLMSLIIDGILTQKLPWILVIIGAFIAILLELCQVSSLPFAVGVYLPFAASFPIFFGGIIRWLVDRAATGKSAAESETSPGVLLSSGLIAGGSIAGILIAFSGAFEMEKILNMSHIMGTYATSDGFSVAVFGLLSLFLFAVGRQFILKSAPPPESAEK